MTEKPIPLSAGQRHFAKYVDLCPNTNHIGNYPVFVSVPRALTVDQVKQAILAVVRHHECTRLRIVRGDQGWTQFLVSEREFIPDFTVVDLKHWDTETRAYEKLVEHVAPLYQRLDHASGCVFTFALFRGSNGSMIAFVSHHLVADFYSGVILATDIASAAEQLASNRSISLPPIPSSFTKYSAYLDQLAQHSRIQDQRIFWEKMRPKTNLAPLPLDYPEGQATWGDYERIDLNWSQNFTTRINRIGLSSFGAWFDEIIFSASAIGIAKWCNTNQVYVNFLQHGRVPLTPVVDPSRTCGLFMYGAPVFIDFKPQMAPESIESAVRTVVHSVRAIPDRGLSYPMLGIDYGQMAPIRGLVNIAVAHPNKYLSRAQLKQHVRNAALYILAQPPIHPCLTWAPENPAWPDPLIDFLIVDDALHLRLFYSKTLFQRETVKRLAHHIAEALSNIAGFTMQG